jgi:hypothetical protein
MWAKRLQTPPDLRTCRASRRRAAARLDPVRLSLRGDDPCLVVGVGEGRLLDGDVRVGLLEIGDQLVHRLDAGVEHILPVFDLNGLSRAERTTC